ncbi:SdpI family protein [Tsukamurella tyrosinosolvens]|uniref:SdpI family protein n=1 Tax=Tsukamurella tyrosinosolvens TaxID=57704 RepID=UPI002DD43FC3|nr:SdpI family protein [Tsukamurella tyrosinosolvens]MEC4616437.1 SdpI family protein [Tsukamurella tyrosinosolvens]
MGSSVEEIGVLILGALAGLAMTAVVVIVLSVTIAAARGRLLPNPNVGIRTPSTSKSPEAWRAGHRAAVPVYAVLVPLVALLDVVICHLVANHSSPASIGLLVILASVVVVIVVIVGAVVAGFAARRTSR